MDVQSDEVESASEEALRRAQIHKLRLETIMALVTIALYAKLFINEDVKYAIRHRIRQFRIRLFGQPPLTEEQIKEAVRQVDIEAAKILRSAE